MITRADVQRLIDAHGEIQKTLGRRRRAARILCEELTWLVDEKGALWEDLAQASTRLRVHRSNERQLFDRIIPLIEQEEAIFKKLGISGPKSEEVIIQAYTALHIIDDQDDPSPASLSNLRNRLAHARELICLAARGPLRRLVEKVLTLKGALVLAGAAIGIANVAIAVVDQGTVSWVSPKAGYHIMKGDVEGLIKLFSGDGGAA